MTLSELKTKTSGTCTGFFIITKCEYKPFKGKVGNFLSCMLSDKTGMINAVQWDGVEKYKVWLKNKMIVQIAGEMAQYNDSPQIVLKAVAEVPDLTKIDLSNFVPCLDRGKVNEMVSELREIKDTIENPICKKIWEEILTEPTLGLFSSCPGGVGDVHHNYCGGLVEHSYTMIKMSQKMLQYHPMDKDILLTGCLIHDVGKIWSYKWDLTLEMSDAGRLLHHTALGYSFLTNVMRTCTWDGFLTDPVGLHLAHIIISHHEEEGIRKPMTPEAQAVAMLDNADASVMFALNFSKRPESAPDEESNWTKFCSLTQRQYYIPKTKV